MLWGMAWEDIYDTLSDNHILASCEWQEKFNRKDFEHINEFIDLTRFTNSFLIILKELFGFDRHICIINIIII